MKRISIYCDIFFAISIAATNSSETNEREIEFFDLAEKLAKNLKKFEKSKLKIAPNMR